MAYTGEYGHNASNLIAFKACHKLVRLSLYVLATCADCTQLFSLGARGGELN